MVYKPTNISGGPILLGHTFFTPQSENMVKKTMRNMRVSLSTFGDGFQGDEFSASILGSS